MTDWLERLDDLHHRRPLPGSWVFCDLHEMTITRDPLLVVRERVSKVCGIRR